MVKIQPPSNPRCRGYGMYICNCGGDGLCICGLGGMDCVGCEDCERDENEDEYNPDSDDAIVLSNGEVFATRKQ
jgi:hypothetical protein